VRRLLALLAAAAVAVVVLPASALAHGGPASHYLETDQLYPGFANRPSQAVELQLAGLLEAARQDGYPIKVGIVGSADDLTEDPSMFGRPQAYAEQVASKLGGAALQAPVVIISPKGVGLAGMHEQDGEMLRVSHAVATEFGARFSVSRMATGDQLAGVAMRAVRRIATAGGHPLPAHVPPAKVLAPISANPSSGFSLPLPLLIFARIFLSAWLYFETRTRLARRSVLVSTGGAHAQHRPD
jgi:hypothetical protein